MGETSRGKMHIDVTLEGRVEETKAQVENIGEMASTLRNLQFYRKSLRVPTSEPSQLDK